MKKPKSFQINLPTIITPSGNETARWIWAHDLKRIGQEKRLYLGMLQLCLGSRREAFQVELGARRAVEFYSFREQLLDDDNLTQGFKMLRDALKKMGIIHDDSPKYLEATYHQEVDRKNPRTEIVVRDV